MARSALNHEFLAEISQQLREGLRRQDALAQKKGKRYTRVHAAADLNVSRASLQFYLAGAHTPSSDVLRRAMELWGIELTTGVGSSLSSISNRLSEPIGLFRRRLFSSRSGIRSRG